MIELTYHQFYQRAAEMCKLRADMVRYANEHGVKPAARAFATTVHTVRKWRDRYNHYGKPGVKDRPRTPKHSPRRIKPHWRFKIVDVFNSYHSVNEHVSAAALRRRYHIPYSLPTMIKVLREEGHKRPQRTISERKRDLREHKQRLRAFERIQIDVKELNDIPEMYREYIRHKLPTYQFTARCVRTGTMFLSYAKEKTVTNATVFLMRLAEHLHAHGVDLTQVTVQTDNGTEFTTPWNSLKDSAFTTVIKTRLYATHRLILFRAGRTFRRVEEPADTRFRRLTRKFSSLPANEKRRLAA